MAPNCVVDVKDFSYTYPGAQAKTLDGISFQLNEGEFALVIGASGSGKSTLIQALNGIVPKIKGGNTEGEIWVAGAKVEDHTVQQMASKIGLIFQDPESQMCNLFVGDEVAFGPENLRVPPEDVVQRVDEALAYVGLKNVKHKYVYEMSGGQQQRLAISSVLSMHPQILALDDPTANLDPVGTAEIVEVLRQMKEQGRTVLLATPWLDGFIGLATRVIVLHEGRLFADGDPREVLARHGETMRDQLGVWLPQISELELKLRSMGLGSEIMPLQAPEAAKTCSKYSFEPAKFEDTGSAPAPEAVVRVSDVNFTYRDGTKALKGVNFEIGKGRLTAILGPNGSGKSTIAKLMVSLLPLKEGNIQVCGLDAKTSSTSDITRRVGFVFQNPEHQFVRETVADEIRYSLDVLGKSKEEVGAGLEEMLDLFDLREFVDRHPFGLSGGQKRRLSVATMLVGRPELLILDEPTYGQDYRNVKVLMKLVKQQLVNGVSIVMITHNMRLVQDYADHVIVMKDGMVKFTGAPRDLWSAGRFEDDVTLMPPPLQQLTALLNSAGKHINPGTRTVDEFVRQLRVQGGGSVA